MEIQEPTVTFFDLPDDILIEILRYLGKFSVLSFLQSCKRFFQLSGNPKMHDRIALSLTVIREPHPSTRDSSGKRIRLYGPVFTLSFATKVAFRSNFRCLSNGLICPGLKRLDFFCDYLDRPENFPNTVECLAVKCSFLSQPCFNAHNFSRWHNVKSVFIDSNSPMLWNFLPPNLVEAFLNAKLIIETQDDKALQFLKILKCSSIQLPPFARLHSFAPNLKKFILHDKEPRPQEHAWQISDLYFEGMEEFQLITGGTWRLDSSGSNNLTLNTSALKTLVITPGPWINEPLLQNLSVHRVGIEGPFLFGTYRIDYSLSNTLRYLHFHNCGFKELNLQNATQLVGLRFTGKAKENIRQYVNGLTLPDQNLLEELELPLPTWNFLRSAIFQNLKCLKISVICPDAAEQLSLCTIPGTVAYLVIDDNVRCTGVLLCKRLRFLSISGANLQCLPAKLTAENLHLVNRPSDMSVKKLGICVKEIFIECHSKKECSVMKNVTGIAEKIRFKLLNYYGADRLTCYTEFLKSLKNIAVKEISFEDKISLDFLQILKSFVRDELTKDITLYRCEKEVAPIFSWGISDN